MFDRSVCVLGLSLSLSAALLVTGCGVPQSEHDALKRKYDEARATLSERETTLAQLRTQHDEATARINTLSAEQVTLNQRLDALRADVDTRQAEIVRLQGEHDRLNQELANLVKDRSRLRDSTERLQEALADLSRRKAEAERRVNEFRQLLARFKSLIDSGKLSVKMVDGRMVLALPSDVLFDSGSATLSTAGRDAVAQVGAILATMNDRRFQVEGHTDNIPIRTAAFPSNWELSSARALGVVKAMVGAGMNAQMLSAAGFGEFHPAASNDTAETRAQNRRIEIVLQPDLSMLPGFDELSQTVAQP